MEFEVVTGNIAEQDVDTIVHPTDTEMGISGAVGVAIFEEGDRSIMDTAIQDAPIGLGKTVVTEAPGLAADHVIHVADKPHHGDRKPSDESIERATRNALKKADELGCSSLAMPAMGCGVGGFDLDSGVRIIGNEIRDYTPGTLATVRLVEKDDAKAEKIAAIIDSL